MRRAALIDLVLQVVDRLSRWSKQFIGDLSWEPISPPDFSISPATLRTEQPIAGAFDDVRRHIEQHGQLVFHRLDWSTYPHIVLRHGAFLFTSVHLALRKR